MWETLTSAPVLITAVFSVISATITGVLAYRAAMYKNTTEARTSVSTAEEKLRDDLLEIIEDYKQVKNEQDRRLAELQGQIDSMRAAYILDTQNLHSMNAELRLQNANLQYENAVLKNDNNRIVIRVKELEDEFAKIERRVYYRPDKDTPKT